MIKFLKESRENRRGSSPEWKPISAKLKASVSTVMDIKL